MGFIIVNTAGSPEGSVDVILNDLGITVPAGGTFDLIGEQPNDVATSLDLVAAIGAGNIEVLDPLDDVTPLSTADAIEMVEVHNDPHFRIRGGDLNQLDDVDTSGASPGDVLQLQSSPNVYMAISPSELAEDINLVDLGDVDGSLVGSPKYGTETFILVGDGSGNAVLTPITGPGSGSPEQSGPFCEIIEDTVGEMIANRSTHSDITVVYTDGAGTCDGTLDFSVDDVFLHNTGPETFGPGTLTFTDGSTLIIGGPGAGSPGTSGSLTIEQDAPATIETPTGGFTNNNDIVNKEYVDSLAAGLDPKESVRVATEPGDTAGTYTAASPCGPGDTITGFPGIIDGVQLENDNRVLVKDRIDPKENGIYVVSGVAGSPVGSPIPAVTLTRAEDQNGNPNNEVSAGNFTHVEQGSQNINTKWVVTGDGQLSLCSDDINWVLFSGPDTIIADVGLTRVANTISLDVGDLSTGVPVLTDTIAFDDAGGTPQGVAASTTYSTSFQDLFEEFNVAYDITGIGIVVRTGGSPDSYTSRVIDVDGPGNLDGLAITNGDGVAGNPTLGLDIQGLPSVLAGSPGGILDTLDEVAVYDQSHDRNVTYTVGQIATALASTNSFETWVGGGNTAGGSPAIIVADSPTDTVTLIGGTGITLDFTTGADSVEWDLDFAAIPAAGSPLTIDSSDEIIINDGGTIIKVTLGDIINQLDLEAFKFVNGDSGTVTALAAGDTLTLSGGVGIATTATGSPQVVTFDIDFTSIPSTGSPLSYGGDTEIIINNGGNTETTTINELLSTTIVGGPGIDVGLAGSPEQVTVSLDICTVTGSGSPNELAATDTVAVCDGSSTVAKTGQDIANGVTNILGITIEEIGGSGSPGQVQLFINDVERNKKLSVAEVTMTYSDNIVQNLGWIEIGNAVDALTGYIVPMNATIVRISGHTSSKPAAAKPIDLYIDGALDTAGIITFAAGAGESEAIDTNLNIDVDAGEKVRLRGGSTGGDIQDTVVTLWLRWRTA